MERKNAPVTGRVNGKAGTCHSTAPARLIPALRRLLAEVSPDLTTLMACVFAVLVILLCEVLA